MKIFNQSFAFFLSLLGTLLLFLPKINLMALGNSETAGLRLDDLSLLFIGIVIFWAHAVLNVKINPLERSVFYIVVFSFFSFGLNRVFVAEGLLNVNASLFYCLRLAEYFVFFYIGALSIPLFKTSNLIRAFFLWNFILIIMQKADLIGQFTNVGYASSVSSRVVGIASFPSETGMLLNLLFCFFIYNKEVNLKFSKLCPPHVKNFLSQTYIYWMFFIFSVLIILTGSRIAIISLGVVFLFRVKEELQTRFVSKWIYASIFLIIGIVVSFVVIQETDSITKRSEGLLSFKNLELIHVVWDKINLNFDPIGNETVKYEAYDMSWWMRIHKWCYALKIYYLNPECWLQGVGPGFAMAALDGGFLRILTEYGIIGSFLFWRLFSSIYRQSIELKWMVIAFSINMIFFDVYLAYKPMSVLFFISGATYAKSIHK